MKTSGRSEKSPQPRPSARRRHWAAVVAVTVTAVGGCAMFLSWGAWGVFVTCTGLMLAAAIAAALMLVPHSVVTGELIVRLAAGSALGLMLIGWGLVGLLAPEYTIGWRIPGKGPNGGIHVKDEGDAHFAGWTLLSLGVFSLAVTAVAGVLPFLRKSRTDRVRNRR